MTGMLNNFTFSLQDSEYDEQICRKLNSKKYFNQGINAYAITDS